MTDRIILGVLIGASIGGMLGFVLQKTGSTCPFTCNPYAGMITGGVLGFLAFFSAAGTAAPENSAAESSRVVEINSSDEFDKMIANNSVVMADFNADWCGPCRTLKPTIHSIADTYKDKVAVLSVNVDRNGDIAQKLLITAIPDVRIYVNGKETNRVVGVRPSNVYTELLDKLAGTKEKAEPVPGAVSGLKENANVETTTAGQTQ